MYTNISNVFALICVFFSISCLAKATDLRTTRERISVQREQDKTVWMNAAPLRQLDNPYTLALEVFEASAFSNLPPEAWEVYRECLGERLPSCGIATIANELGQLLKANASEMLTGDLKLAEAYLNKTWYRTNSHSLEDGPRPHRFIVGPDGLASTTSRILQRNNQKQLTSVPVRKEYRCMSYQERDKYHRAVNRLKKFMIAGISAYDIFSLIYNSETSPGANYGPASLLWHRHFLFVYEEAIRQMDPQVTLPYWDPSMDARLSQPLTSSIWRDDYLGTPDGEVTEGPFLNWITLKGDILQRHMTGKVDLLHHTDLHHQLGEAQIFSQVFPVLEAFTTGPRMYVGGHIGNITTAPMDPLFFMHRAYVDCLWEEWRQLKQYPNDTEDADYPGNDEMDKNGFAEAHRISALMRPFNVRNALGTAELYTHLYYKCQPRGVCSSNICSNDGHGGSDCALVVDSTLDEETSETREADSQAPSRNPGPRPEDLTVSASNGALDDIAGGHDALISDRCRLPQYAASRLCRHFSVTP